LDRKFTFSTVHNILWLCEVAALNARGSFSAE
jgi:hypothetical protein